MKKQVTQLAIATAHIRMVFRKGLFLSAEGKSILLELPFFNDDLLKFICLGKPATIQEFERLVNVHRTVHQRIETEEKYTVGQANKLFAHEPEDDSRMQPLHGRSENDVHKSSRT